MKPWQCPTCRAPYKGGKECYRCHGDLSMLVAILEQAEDLKAQAILHLKENQPKEALKAIQYSLFLCQDPEAEELAALIYAAEGEFNQVLPYLGG